MSSIAKLSVLLKESKRISTHDEDKIQEWSAEVLVHLDNVLGPSKINLHSPEYDEFKKGKFPEKVAILKSVIEVKQPLFTKVWSNKVFSGLFVTVVGGLIVLLLGKVFV
ncbi:hypothetical protein LQK64_004398 [Vibrio vulnificus]|nr:hypothetical protein [Vibrio vulnificus]